jgi:Protein of unknown function (DUF3551)
MKNLIGGSLATALLATAALALATPASASIEYPWCAQYSDGWNGPGGTNCGFETWKQCMDTIRGTGGICYENSRYDSRIEQPAKRHHKRHVRD